MSIRLSLHIPAWSKKYPQHMIQLQVTIKCRRLCKIKIQYLDILYITKKTGGRKRLAIVEISKSFDLLGDQEWLNEFHEIGNLYINV